MERVILFQIRAVSKHYRKGPEIIRAVDFVSLDIPRGEFLAIQGPSGSGKSTLLHLIVGLDLPTSGEIIFDGNDITRLNDRALSILRGNHFGFVFQSFNLIPELDILQNVTLPLKYARKRNRRGNHVLEIIEALGLTDRLHHRPSELSGGEEQRVAFARALVNNPDVILADEPTGNLDTQNRDVLLDLFKNLHTDGQTIVIVTHDPVVAQAARRQLMMKDGRILEE
jgi:putative ABC transport system ATP-binding protein